MDHVRYGVAVSGRAAFLLARLIDPASSNGVWTMRASEAASGPSGFGPR